MRDFDHASSRAHLFNIPFAKKLVLRRRINRAVLRLATQVAQFTVLALMALYVGLTIYVAILF